MQSCRLGQNNMIMGKSCADYQHATGLSLKGRINSVVRSSGIRRSTTYAVDLEDLVIHRSGSDPISPIIKEKCFIKLRGVMFPLGSSRFMGGDGQGILYASNPLSTVRVRAVKFHVALDRMRDISLTEHSSYGILIVSCENFKE